MPDEVKPTETAEAEQPFDPKAFIAGRNEAHAAKQNPAATPAKPEEKKAEEAKPIAPGQDTTEEHPEDRTPRMSRAQRREHNRLLRELGEETGRRKALEEMVAHLKTGGKTEAAAEGKTETAKTDDPEPQKKDFADYDTYSRALSRWEARQETKKTLSEGEQQNTYREHIQAMAEKANEDIKSLPDWAEVQKEAMEDGPEFVPSEHPNLMGLIASSDMQAFLLYHLAKHPAELEKMLELSNNPGEQIRQFARLEGRIEKLYAKDSAAQAGDRTAPKDRNNSSEKAAEARATSAADRDVRKPRPTSEVAARGGTAAPDEPAVGSVAWMARRNQTQFGK